MISQEEYLEILREKNRAEIEQLKLVFDYIISPFINSEVTF